MKTLKLSIFLAASAGLWLAGCSQSTQSVTGPAANTSQSVSVDRSVQPSAPVLDKKGPVVHYANGSANGSYNGKNMAWVIAAHQYADGSVGGEYEINAANALDETYQKWNGKVLFLKVYGKIAVVGGIEKTGESPGWYDVFFLIDNGQGAKATSPDQTSIYVGSIGTLSTAQKVWNYEPSVLMEGLGVMPIDRGNFHVN
ncbi:MAG: hypothetical protein M1378_08115 [Bacteroidetes bacterium]|nr:hypothetical protein [Bacteroidota bacterium]